MSTFMRCPMCGKVQRDIMGEHIWTNEEGDILDLTGKPADAIIYEPGWMPIKCEHCGLVMRERDWPKATRKEWALSERVKCRLLVWWDRFWDYFRR